MLHRAHWPVVTVLSVLVILLAGSPWTGITSDARADELAIRFDDINTFVHAGSPRARILAQEVAAINAGTNDEFQWSNPALAYDYEETGPFREWQISLSKRFVSPFSQSSLRNGRQQRLRSAELQAEQEIENLLAELKSGYVRLQLLETYLGHLDRLAELVNLTSAVADNRHAEGELSGVEKDLVQLAAYSIDATRRRVRQEHGLYTAQWRSEMGIEPEATIDLATPVTYRPVFLDDASDYAALLHSRPGNQAQLTRAQALGQLSAAAGPRLVPAVDIYGGYRQVEPSLDGFAAGIAIDLPLFQHNSGRARRLEAERLIVENEQMLDLVRARGDIESLVDLIEAVQPPLGNFTNRLEDRPPLADTLLFSYREGSLTLGALLGAIQIESAALENYYVEMTAYYLNVFRLEAITGASIVQFAS
jgi:hypothetical protein